MSHQRTGPLHEQRHDTLMRRRPSDVDRGAPGETSSEVSINITRKGERDLWAGAVDGLMRCAGTISAQKAR